MMKQKTNALAFTFVYSFQCQGFDIIVQMHVVGCLGKNLLNITERGYPSVENPSDAAGPNIWSELSPRTL